MNKYIFQSNNSDNVTIEDQFLFSKTVEANEIAIRDYPMMTKSPGKIPNAWNHVGWKDRYFAPVRSLESKRS